MVTETETLQRPSKKIFLFVKNNGRYIEYRAVYEDLELWGRTVGAKNDVKNIVKRIILAELEPPWSAIEAAVELAKYVSSTTTAISTAKEVRGSVTVEIGLDKLKLSVAFFPHAYDDEDEDKITWRGKVSALYVGDDALIDNATHKVIKRMIFEKEVDVTALNRELLRVARHAYNAHDLY